MAADVYLIYGRWHQFAAVVNRPIEDDEIADPDGRRTKRVFIRGVAPVEGVEIMAAQ